MCATQVELSLALHTVCICAMLRRDSCLDESSVVVAADVTVAAVLFPICTALYFSVQCSLIGHIKLAGVGWLWLSIVQCANAY
jgi:hypothetical protein